MSSLTKETRNTGDFDQLKTRRYMEQGAAQLAAGCAHPCGVGTVTSESSFG
jgi:hypothetical protein